MAKGKGDATLGRLSKSLGLINSELQTIQRGIQLMREAGKSAKQIYTEYGKQLEKLIQDEAKLNEEIEERKELVKNEETTQKIQLVHGNFTPSEASHIIMSLLDEKINFHKIQRLQVLSGDQKSVTGDLDDRITELEKEKEIARAFISEKKMLGQRLQIDGVLKLSNAKNPS